MSDQMIPPTNMPAANATMPIPPHVVAIIEQMIDARMKVWGDAVVSHVIEMIKQERVLTVQYIDGRIIEPMTTARPPVDREWVLDQCVEFDITASELIAARKAAAERGQDHGSADRTD